MRAFHESSYANDATFYGGNERKLWRKSGGISKEISAQISREGAKNAKAGSFPSHRQNRS
jgi:hypothetical protein